jgi:hypothetical protein
VIAWLPVQSQKVWENKNDILLLVEYNNKGRAIFTLKNVKISVPMLNPAKMGLLDFLCYNS